MAQFTRLSIIKFFELIVVCVLIGLHYHSFQLGNLHTTMLTMSTIGGFLIILVGLFAGHVMGTPVNRRVDLFFSLIGCILFIVVGALNIQLFESYYGSNSMHDIGMAKGSICIIEGALFLFDAILTFRGEA